MNKVLSALPPGVTEDMIPGNRPEDVKWEDFHAQVYSDSIFIGLHPDEALEIWNLGLRNWKENEKEAACSMETFYAGEILRRGTP